MSSFLRRLRAYAALALCVGLTACESDPVHPAPRRPGALATARINSAPADSVAATVARGLALALGDSVLRAALLIDLRDSPFPYHSVHLQSYLAGKSGRELARVAASRLGLTPPAFMAAVRALPSAALGAPAVADRHTWTGGAEVVVAGTSLPREHFTADPVVAAYTTAGAQVSVRMDRPSAPGDAALIAFSQVPFSFGTDPEDKRTRAPKKSGRTVAGDDVSPMVLIPCEEDPYAIDCNPPPPPPPPPSSGPPTASIGISCSPNGLPGYVGGYSAVTPANDLDQDGIKDECEQLLAEAFEPRLVFDALEPHRHREPHHIVQNRVILSATTGYTLELTIGYLLSYYYDGGAVSHNGDSEFILVAVAPNGNGWAVKHITTSAHRGATFGWWFDETRTYDWSGYVYEQGTKAKIWVSRNHHGNYNTELRCNSRIGDYCWRDGPSEPAGRGYAGRTGLRPDNNIGSLPLQFPIDPLFRFGSTVDGGVVTSCTRAEDPTRPGVECFFKNVAVIPPGVYAEVPAGQFAGWAGSGGVTSYADILRDYGFLDPRGRPARPR